jgi:hypothetical protein
MEAIMTFLPVVVGSGGWHDISWFDNLIWRLKHLPVEHPLRGGGISNLAMEAILIFLPVVLGSRGRHDLSSFDNLIWRLKQLPGG